MQQPYTTIIIDDERLVRLYTTNILKQFPLTFSIIGEADCGKAGIAIINKLKPSLIILDISMPDMTGFEMLSLLEHKPLVVFATAYDTFALKAFEENSIDYLLKPIEENRLLKTIEKLNTRSEETQKFDYSILQKLINIKEQQKCLTTLSVKVGNKIFLIQVNTISFFEAKEKYVAIHTQDGREYLTEQTLNALSEKLPNDFIRVQKSFILNKNHISEIQKHVNNRLHITMNDKVRSTLLTGNTYIEDIRIALGI
jgi:two-component system, LytTR family, response regulator